jgi:hypothetical protein
MSILKNMVCTYSKVRRGTNGLSTLLLLPKNLASVTDATYCTDRRNIRLIEGNAKCRHLKD